MAKKNTLILFDCFGVLYKRVVKSFFELYYGDPEAGRLTNLYTKNRDLGKGHFLDIAKDIEKDLGFDEKEVIEEWKTLVKRNDELFDLIDKLRETCNVSMLSNCARGQIQFIEDETEPIGPHFDNLFLSCQTGLAKPNLDFYKNAINSYKQKFDTIIMVDDSIENLKPLEPINVIGFEYTDNETLIECFKSLGIID